MKCSRYGSLVRRMSPNSQGHQQRLLTAGYTTLDLIVRDLEHGDYWQEIGGTCGNVSVFATALGADVTLLTRIGDDTRGELLLQKALESGVSATHLERILGLSTPAIVELLSGDGEGTHQFVFRCPLCTSRLPKAAVVSKRHAEAMVGGIDSYDAYFFDRATPSTVRLAEAARDAGLLIVFEPTIAPRTERAERAAALSDIVKVSEQPRGAMNTWHPARGASTQFVVETLGSRGTRFKSRSLRGWGAWRVLPAAERACIRDTAGAGDWLTAGLVTHLLPQRAELTVDAVQAALEYGQRLSALSLAFDGPHGPLRELGAATIRDLSRRPSATEVRPQSPSLAHHRRKRTEHLAACCDLCLTADH